jgi:altronate hydrolase
LAEYRFRDHALLLNERDHVAVLKRPLREGDELVDGPARVAARQDIPRGHKIAVHDVDQGAAVRKYGQIIGFAVQRVQRGDHVHCHNLEVKDFGRDYEFGVDVRPVDPMPQNEMRFFHGYQRPDGRVGTRNYVGVLSSVNCSATVAKYVVQRFDDERLYRDYPHVDGVVAFTHKTGCCAQPGEPSRVLQRVMAGFARHPNIFGYVMIGLGCEGNQVPVLVEEHQLNVVRPGAPQPAFMTIQETGGIAKTVDAATAAIEKLLPIANQARRTPQPISKLVLAEQCGGSDANSGITGNPALGVAADRLICYGGAAVLAETPEIYGAEHLLTRRAARREVGEKLVELIRWWEAHARMHDATIDNNPTPGNKMGGLTTIYEKSLGAVAKAGQSPLAAVYNYADLIDTPGLGFMDSPGYDPVSMTGLVAGGANVAAFTTGRGSCYGCKPTPCIKIATNTSLYESMTDDMDVNAGTIIDGTESLQDVGERIFEMMIAVASGEQTKSERQGVGDEEFCPWQIGPTF